MAATISESYLSRPFSLGLQAGRELIFDLQGTDDEVAVQTLLLGTAPPVYGGLALESISAEPVWVDTVAHQGIWKGRAKYVRIADDTEYTFDTGGGTTKITQSLATINAYAPAGLTAPDCEGGIGVSEDRVEGVDITTPTYQFSETHRFADGSITPTYKAALFSRTGTVNDGTFKGFNAGEVLFMGATGSKRGDEQWSLTFRFAASPNVSGLAVGPITGIDKDGWDYLWIRYAEFEDSSAQAVVKRPIGVYIERTYHRMDFSVLNIGT